jgi:porin
VHLRTIVLSVLRRKNDGAIAAALIVTSTLLPVVSAWGQDDQSDRGSRFQPQAIPAVLEKPRPVEQELDSIATPLANMPSDPLLRSDFLGPLMAPFQEGGAWLRHSARLNLGGTYTFLNQYAGTTPRGVRHDQLSGRLDLNGNLVVYNGESTAASIGMLVRSGTNIGMSQQWNLSDALGSGLYLNCLQGGGAQRPITLNILYWRQDFFRKRLSFYAGKIHPNQYISLSLFNNDERSQFLNGENDGNLAIASDGTYAGGGALEYQISRHWYAHSVAVDTEGSQQSTIATMADRKFLEAVEIGWFSRWPGNRWRNYRFAAWRDDTKTQGSGHGVAFAFDHELRNGWAPFGRFGFATATGTSIKQTNSVGVANVRPFGRRGDMFGLSLNYTEPGRGGKHHESLVETFYRLRLTRSLEVGPDLQVVVHPTYSTREYTTVLFNARMRIIF